MIELTNEEKKLVGFFLALAIEDTEKGIKKAKLGKDSFAAKQLAKIQRITYTKFIPESLTGDDELADGSILKKQ